jgi:hypothetical protein
MNRNHSQGKLPRHIRNRFLGAKLMRCESILHPAPKEDAIIRFWLTGVHYILKT